MLINLECLGYRTVINYDNMLSRFQLMSERHRRTDRRTDRIAISISRVSVLTLDKNSVEYISIVSGVVALAKGPVICL